MKFSKNLNPMGLFAEIMTNKYFLIFMAVFSAINIVGYLSMGYTHTVILFAMVAYLTFVFSKNMTVVLLVSVIIVNLYMHAMGGGVEGLTSRKDGTDLSKSGVAMDGKLGLINMEDTEVDEVEEEETEITSETVEESFSDGVQPGDGVQPAEKKKDPRIDYASTLKSAYGNLESMLSSGGLSNLSKETQELMQQQNKLFESMEGIAPLLRQAQEMMTTMKFNEDKENIGGSLANMATPIVEGNRSMKVGKEGLDRKSSRNE